MVLYRRNRVPDGTFFFTATLRDRSSDALVRHVDALRAAWQAARVRVPHAVIASVVLPDHLHAVIEMRDGAGDYSRLWQEIKKGFTRRTRPFAGAASPWQSRFWEHTIRDQADLRAHIDYVHVNPMSMGWSDGSPIGRIRHFIVTSAAVICRSVGRAIGKLEGAPVSGDPGCAALTRATGG